MEGCVDMGSRREGCMTDKVIANIKEKYDNIDDIDGLDELKYPSPILLFLIYSNNQRRRQEHDQRSHRARVKYTPFTGIHGNSS